MTDKKQGVRRLTGNDLIVIRSALVYLKPTNGLVSNTVMPTPAMEALSQRLDLIIEKVDQEIESRKESK